MDFEVFDRIRNKCSEKNITLVAVSKTKSVENIQKLYDFGQRAFGENRIQEWAEKASRLPGDIHWHLIGHLQTNKVKYLDPIPELIHSGDRVSLLNALEKEGQKQNVYFNILLQIKIAEEESKYGFSIPGIIELASSGGLNNFIHVKFTGVMGMATFTEDLDKIRSEFRALKNCFEILRKHINQEGFCEISMGMSGDYEVALEEGSTIIRVGSLIFGSR